MCLAGLLNPDVPYCRPSDTLRQATERMWRHGCDALPVCDEHRAFLGLVTSRCICVRAYATGRRLADLSVLEATTADVASIEVGRSDEEALELMTRERLWQLPVIDAGGCLLGEVQYERLREALMSDRERIVVLDGRDQLEDLGAHPGQPGTWVFVLALRDLVSPDGASRSLSRGEARLLAVLAGNAGRAISRELLMQSVCNRSYCPGDRYIDVLVSNLRRKFAQLGAEAIVIRTIHNGGYAFNLVVAGRGAASLVGPDQRRPEIAQRGAHVGAGGEQRPAEESHAQRLHFERYHSEGRRAERLRAESNLAVGGD